MKLTRDEFCKLTDMDPERLKSLVRRDLLPHPAKSEKVPEGKKNYYTPIQALKMVMVDDLSAGGGIPIQHALAHIDFVESELSALSSKLDALSPQNKIFAASMEVEYGKGQRAVLCWGGTIHKIAETITKAIGDISEGDKVGRIIMICVSDAYRRVMERSHKHGIYPEWKWK